MGGRVMDEGYTEAEVEAARWLFNRIMEERSVFYHKEQITILKWDELEPGVVRTSWLDEGRKIVALVNYHKQAAAD